MITTAKDRWNLSKLKVLRSLARMGDSNSIRIAEATRKTVDATDHTIKRLLGFKHIKIIPYNKNNDGCCNRYALTPKGKKYLKTLDSRFIYSDDLNLKFHPRHIDYTPDTIAWKSRSYPPGQVECFGNEYEFNLSQTTKDNIFTHHLRELQFFTKEEKHYAKGDYFKIYDLDTYVLYYIESFSIQEYAKIFSRYRTPKDPEQYLLKLQSDHPGSKFCYILYFKKYKARPQEKGTDQRIAKFLNDKTTTNDNLSIPTENTPKPILEGDYYFLFEQKINDIVTVKGIDYQVLETTPLPLGQMVDIEYQSHSYNSPDEYMQAWLLERNATKPTRDWIVYRCVLQAQSEEYAQSAAER